MRGRITILLMILLFATSVAAIDFTATIEPESKTIRLNESAFMTLTVEHDSESTEFFQIYSPDVAWDITTQPIGDRLLQVEPGEKKQTQLVVKPLYVQPGFYGVGLTVKHSGGTDLVKKAMMIGVVPEKDEQGQYSASVFADLKMNSKVDPRNPFKIFLTLKNQNRRNLHKLDVKLRSELINKDITTSLGPLQEKTLEIEVELDPATPPQEDQMTGTVFAQSNNRVLQFDLSPVRFRIVPFGDIATEEENYQEFLQKKQVFKFHNTANTLRDRVIQRNVSYVQSWFLESNPDPTVKKVSGGYIYVWEILLEAGESSELEISTNYGNLFWVFLLLFVLLVVYLNLRAPIVVKKTALVIERQQGGVSQLKVLLTIRNRTGRSVRNLIIKDKVPAIATISKDHSMGSLKPEKVMHYESGEALIKWNLAHLESREERLVSYTIRTKLHVLGSLQLPPAQVRYKFYGWDRKVISKVEKLYR